MADELAGAPEVLYETPCALAVAAYITIALKNIVGFKKVPITLPDGRQCFQEVRKKLPSCTWAAERYAGNGDSTKNNIGSINSVTISNALLVFPNPTSGDVTLSYDYGTDSYSERSLSIFDATGRKIQTTMTQEARGHWNVNTNIWTPGVYIIRMEADGKALQVQRMVVVGK